MRGRSVGWARGPRAWERGLSGVCETPARAPARVGWCGLVSVRCVKRMLLSGRQGQKRGSAPPKGGLRPTKKVGCAPTSSSPTHTHTHTHTHAHTRPRARTLNDLWVRGGGLGMRGVSRTTTRKREYAEGAKIKRIRGETRLNRRGTRPEVTEYGRPKTMDRYFSRGYQVTGLSQSSVQVRGPTDP